MAAKPDSYDICFIPDGDTHGYLVDKLGARRGAVVDAESGEVLAEHDGVLAYTIGQRKGLGVQRPAADGKPRYVPVIEPVSGTVRVGSARNLEVHAITADRAVWTSGSAPVGPVECTVQVRRTAVSPRPSPKRRRRHRDLPAGAAHRCREGAGRRLLYRTDAAGDIVLGSGTISGTDARPNTQ